MNMLRTFLLPAAAMLVLLTSGCGYRVGSLMHPQIKTVGIAPVTNETTSYNLAAQVRGLLCEAFMTDGSLKLVDEKTADCIVYARVVGVTFTEISWAEENASGLDNLYTPNQWRVTLNIEYTVFIPGRGEPLIPTRNTSGSADFEGGPDQEIGRTHGIRQAAYAAAKNVVAGLTEGW